MRLRHIEIFHAIYTTGSITNAARMLYVSQPSVSKVLSHAEMQLGFKLFERNKGKLIPTAEANMLFDEVDKIYKQLYTIKKKAENIRQHRDGLVDIAVTPALGFELIPDAITGFRQSHPHVQFKLQTLHNEEALRSLQEQRCALLILYASPTMPGVTEIPLGESEMVLLYPKALYPSMPARIPVKQLENMDLIDIWDSGPLGELIWSHLADASVEVNSSLQVDTYFIAANLVRKGLGCCTIDRFTAQANLCDEMGMIAFDPPVTFTIKALHLEATPLPKVCADFLRYFSAETRQLQPLDGV